MAKKGKVLERVQVTTTREHWTQFFRDEFDVCGVPSHIAIAPTPEAAWKAARADELIWALTQVDVSIKPFVDEYGDEKPDLTADQIRKRYPKPPRKLLAILNRWLKKKE